MLPRISVCIPAYRRAKYLPPLLESLKRQTRLPFEVVIREDDSDERGAIAQVVDEFRPSLPINYIENPHTYGYDANVRACIEAASGNYCLMMGNDDLLCPEAVETINRVIEASGEIGVISRAYAIFRDDPSNVVQEIRHFPGIRLFDPGCAAVVALYRRTGVLSGIVFNRRAAREIETARWDGSLYYQLYLTANILLDLPGAYIDRRLVLCREGVPPEFGRSAAEAPFYTPGQYTSAARLKMFGSMVEIIREAERRKGVELVGPVLRDLGAYSYYLLAGHPTRPLGEFMRYYRELGKIGVGSHPLYHVYFLLVASLGDGGSARLIERVRRLFGRTPRLSGIDAGRELRLDSRSA
jgi:abequosyltransferase